MPQLHSTPTLPQLRIEQAPLDETEADCLAQLSRLVEAAEPMPDVRTMAPAIRELFPAPSYQVGCGGAHIWLHRTDDTNRLAIIREDR